MPVHVCKGCCAHLDPTLAVAHAVPHRVVPQLLRPLIAAPILPDSIHAPPFATASTVSFMKRIDIWEEEAFSAALQYASQCPNLTFVELLESDVDETVIAQIAAEVPKLRVLSLQYCDGVDAEAAAAIAEISSIRRLDLTWCSSFRSESLAVLTNLARLQALTICGCRVTADGFHALTKLQDLKELSLAGSRFTLIDEAEAACLSRLPRLHTLLLDRCDIVDPPTVLQVLSHLPLRSLCLVNCKGMDAAALSHLPRGLRTLNLQGCRDVDAAALKHIGELTQLVDLNLAECVEVGGVGLSHLARLRRLSRLDLSECPLVDSLALVELSSQVWICALLVSGCERVDPAAVEQLRQRIPHVTF